MTFAFLGLAKASNPALHISSLSYQNLLEDLLAFVKVLTDVGAKAST